MGPLSDVASDAGGHCFQHSRPESGIKEVVMRRGINAMSAHFVRELHRILDELQLDAKGRQRGEMANLYTNN